MLDCRKCIFNKPGLEEKMTNKLYHKYRQMICTHLSCLSLVWRHCVRSFLQRRFSLWPSVRSLASQREKKKWQLNIRKSSLHQKEKGLTYGRQYMTSICECLAKQSSLLLILHHWASTLFIVMPGSRVQKRFLRLPFEAVEEHSPPTLFIICPLAPRPPSSASSRRALACWDFCRACTLTLSELFP